MEHSKKVNVIVVLFLIAAMGASLFAGINFAKAEENEVYHGEFIGLSGNLSDRELRLIKPIMNAKSDNLRACGIFALKEE